LFENAIEESIKVEEKDRSISIQIDSDIHKILIKVINTCVAERAKDSKALPITSKKEYAHGLGLKSVKMTCEIFGGTFFWSCENNIFTASAIVNR
jgi:sensor histidine kinase regulating citrate/malate metabolism